MRTTFIVTILLVISCIQPASAQFEVDDFVRSTKIPGSEGGFAVIATDGQGGTFVTYQGSEDATEAPPHIYFAYSHDYGDTWSNSYRVNDNASSSVWCDSPNIAFDEESGTIYIVWKDNRTGISKLYMDHSLDRGRSFGDDVLVHDAANDLIPPWLPFTADIEVVDGVVYLAWITYYSLDYYDSSVLFSKSLDGVDFTDPLELGDPGARYTSPAIVVDGDHVYVGFSKRGDSFAHVYLVTSLDGGKNFGELVRINDADTQVYTGGLKLVQQAQRIHAVWTDNRAGTGTQYLDIYYAYSDNGQSFSTNVKVNDDTGIMAPDPAVHPHFTRGAQGTPTVAVHQSGVHVIWEDFRNFEDDEGYCRDAYYAYFEDGTFSSNIRINSIDPASASVNIADPNSVIDAQGNLYVVYSDAVSGDNSHHSIYFTIAKPKPSSSSDVFYLGIFGIIALPALKRLKSTRKDV